tara:strand:+ start:342 stop:581 length:240 start_codon:yes stop_codon:yes gene_type:complete
MAINLRNEQWDESGAIPNASLISRMRKHRNRLLTESDWTQTADNPISNKAAWATWRQQLRDFPATWTPAETVDFPEEPS